MGISMWLRDEKSEHAVDLKVITRAQKFRLQKSKLKTMAIYFNKQDLLCLRGRKPVVGGIGRLLKRNSRARGATISSREGAVGPCCATMLPPIPHRQ
jgi:hypothetical protein